HAVPPYRPLPAGSPDLACPRMRPPRAPSPGPDSAPVTCFLPAARLATSSGLTLQWRRQTAARNCPGPVKMLRNWGTALAEAGVTRELMLAQARGASREEIGAATGPVFASADAKEEATAFTEKREPRWTGALPVGHPASWAEVPQGMKEAIGTG